MHRCPPCEGCSLSIEVFVGLFVDFGFGLLVVFFFFLGAMREQQTRAGGNKGCQVSLVAWPLRGHGIGREFKTPKLNFTAGPSLLGPLNGTSLASLFCISPAQARRGVALRAPGKNFCPWWGLAGAAVLGEVGAWCSRCGISLRARALY